MVDGFLPIERYFNPVAVANQEAHQDITGDGFIIDEQGKIAHIFPKVKVQEHYDEVIDALEQTDGQ